MRSSSTDSTKALFVAAGAIAIITGILPMAGTILLSGFGYPEIIRETPQVILTRLYEMRATVPYLYYMGIGGAGLGVFFLTVLLSRIFQAAGDSTWGQLGKYCGMVNGLCLYGGIIRWTFLFPALAELRTGGGADPRTVDVVFKAFNTYVGDSIAEHVGFTFMALWLAFMSLAILKTKIVNKWMGISGLILGLVVMYGNLEFFGLPGAFAVNRTCVELVPLWAMALGVHLIWIRDRGIAPSARPELA
jgi:hypothetical protein